MTDIAAVLARAMQDRDDEERFLPGDPLDPKFVEDVRYLIAALDAAGYQIVPKKMNNAQRGCLVGGINHKSEPEDEYACLLSVDNWDSTAP